MQKTRKGIDLIFDDNSVSSDVLVVDAELLFNISSSFFAKKSYSISDDNRRMLHHLSEIGRNFDEILVGVVANYDYSQHVASTLKLQFNLVDLQDEQNYKTWLQVIRPTKHVAIRKRKHYYNTSEEVKI
jgi:hypothetical protein